jgi:hypothetical protein
MLTHGIDLHKRDLVIATVDAEGAEVKQKRVRACEADVLRYFSTLSGPHRAVGMGSISCLPMHASSRQSAPPR